MAKITYAQQRRLAMTGSQTRLAKDDVVSWRVSERVLFRIAFCYILIYYTPVVLGVIPGSSLAIRWYLDFWNLIAATVFHVSFDSIESLSRPTGSGDTILAYIHQAAMLMVALSAAAVWSGLDRKRPSYVWLNGWLRVFARFALAFTLASYALAKIIPTQFSQLSDRQLAETYGQSSPMALLWNFMGFSTAYTVFAGCSELLPAILLVFRRTALLGSLLSFVVLMNVAALNFCYDVPVKLLSLNLLFLSAFLLLPDARRLSRIFLFNLPVSPSNLREPWLGNQRTQRIALSLKVVVLGIFLTRMIYSEVASYRAFTARTAATPAALTTRGFHWIQEYPYNR
jgi:hypothetical protein